MSTSSSRHPLSLFFGFSSWKQCYDHGCSHYCVPFCRRNVGIHICKQLLIICLDKTMMQVAEPEMPQYVFRYLTEYPVAIVLNWGRGAELHDCLSLYSPSSRRLALPPRSMIPISGPVCANHLRPLLNGVDVLNLVLYEK